MIFKGVHCYFMKTAILSHGLLHISKGMNIKCVAHALKYGSCITVARRSFVSYRERLLEQLSALDDDNKVGPGLIDNALNRYIHDSTGTKFFGFEEELCNILANDDNLIPVSEFIARIQETGVRTTDPRLEQCMTKMNNLRKKAQAISFTQVNLEKEEFVSCARENVTLIKRAFTGDFVIPEFAKFCSVLNEVYWECRNNHSGKVASYIPQLSKFSPNYWGVSMCSIDGQRHSLGEVGVPFCLQSCAKPLAYGLALDGLGCETFHQYVGQEPSGITFNAIQLDQWDKPHNPMINAGAIVTASLVQTNLRLADRFDFVSKQFKRMAGNEFIGFNNSVFLSERETADRNFALGYYLKEYNCFPYGCNITETMDFYFMMCSVEVTCESAAVIAATLANGGICPLTGEEIFSSDAIRNILSLMHSCGMYDYSGQFAFSVGLPAKSGVSGCVLLVVPNLMGICLWSPPLDSCGNSVRGIQFCQSLVKRFNFHQFDNLNATRTKQDPRRQSVHREESGITNLLFGACHGDLGALKRMALSGFPMELADYDGRTALHLAACEGHINCARFLLNHCNVPLAPTDRWGSTPYDDAVKHEQTNIAEFLKNYTPIVKT